jgi:CRP-like cAMP-binding protein
VNKEDLEFFKECDLFIDLDDELIEWVFTRGEVVKLSPGAKLFEIGEPSDKFFVIKSGVVEICRPLPDSPQDLRVVAYLGSSDSMGEMSIITGSSHGSMARMPAGGEVYQLTRDKFMRLVDAHHRFAKHLMILFANRLESRVKDMRIAKRHLNGNLRFFDLPTVIQTIIASKLTGTLVLTNEQQEPIAEVNFEQGEVRSAFLENLSGQEAFMQLFQPPPQDGNFDFKSGPIQDVGDHCFEINCPTMNLLMESVRLQDELMEMKQTIKDEDIFKPLQDELDWGGEEANYPFALQIWLLLQEGRYTVAELRVSTLRCHYYCYSVLQRLLQTGQIALITVLSV